MRSKTKNKLFVWSLFWTLIPLEFKKSPPPSWNAIRSLIRKKWNFNQNSKSDIEITAAAVHGPLIATCKHSASPFQKHRPWTPHGLPGAGTAWWKWAASVIQRAIKVSKFGHRVRETFWRESLLWKVSWWCNFLLCTKLRLSWNLVDVCYKSVTANETQAACATQAALRGPGATLETCIFLHMRENSPEERRGNVMILTISHFLNVFFLTRGSGNRWSHLISWVSSLSFPSDQIPQPHRIISCLDSVITSFYQLP